MRSSLHLACVLCFDQAFSASAVAMDRRFELSVEPLVRALEENDRLSLVVHLAGRLLEHAVAHRPQLLGRISALSQQGRLELLGGAFFSPVLGSIPERDAVGQLRFTANWLNRNINATPTGAWLPLRAWDPTLPSVFAEGGVKYTLVDDALFFGAGLRPGIVHGHFVNHRAGNSVSVFPIDGRLSRVLASAALPRAEQILDTTNHEHQGTGDQVSVVAFPGDDMVSSGRLAELVRLFSEQTHWLKTITLRRAFETFPTRGPVNLLTGADPGFVEYAEANHLHKRMLATSEVVDRLRKILNERQLTKRVSQSDAHARKVLERACDGLWRAQSHAVFWHRGKGHAGVYDPALRIATTRQLMQAQRMVEKALGDPAKGGWWGVARDYD